MTEFELIATLKETSVGIALDFEFFLTITFALIVVSYTVGDRLSRAPRIVISCLYLATVFMLFVRYQGHASQALFIATKLGEMKSEWPVLDVVTIMWTRRFIFLAGTVAALFAIFTPLVVTRGETDEHGT